MIIYKKIPMLFVGLLFAVSPSLAMEQEDIFQAAAHGNIARVQELLDGGVDVNVQDQANWTPLLLAAMYCHEELVHLLIEQGADVNARTYTNANVLQIVINCYPINAMQKLRIMRLLIEKGADVNAQDENNNTPLHFAACMEHATFIPLLLQKHADMSLKNNNHQTPAHIAHDHNFPANAAYLESAARTLQEADTLTREQMHVLCHGRLATSGSPIARIDRCVFQHIGRYLAAENRAQALEQEQQRGLPSLLGCVIAHAKNNARIIGLAASLAVLVFLGFQACV